MTKCLDDLKGMTLLADGEYISRPWFTYLVEVLQVDDIINGDTRLSKKDCVTSGNFYNPCHTT